VAGSVAVVVGDPAAGAVRPAPFSARAIEAGETRTAAADAEPPLEAPGPAPWVLQPAPVSAVAGVSGAGDAGATGWLPEVPGAGAMTCSARSADGGAVAVDAEADVAEPRTTEPAVSEAAPVPSCVIAGSVPGTTTGAAAQTVPATTGTAGADSGADALVAAEAQPSAASPVVAVASGIAAGARTAAAAVAVAGAAVHVDCSVPSPVVAVG
jgi:hypothetical protein